MTEWAAVATMCAGLAMTVPASGAQAQHPGPAVMRWFLPGLFLVVLLIGAFAGRFADRPRALLLGLGRVRAGVVEAAIQLIGSLSIPRIFVDPAFYGVLLGEWRGFSCRPRRFSAAR
ncbi:MULTISPECIES: hypothetical protein [unclassified Streptomyces]|uniref:hypothetical protein n=1 Tax=unclassified Streptomyces TaxID=2593676 RepID=UPI00351F32E4